MVERGVLNTIAMIIISGWLSKYRTNKLRINADTKYAAPRAMTSQREKEAFAF
jgi:hypothetical protein